MVEAFNYMFKDNKFKSKAIIYFIIALISNACLYFSEESFQAASKANSVSVSSEVWGCLFLALITSAILTGYFTSCVKAIVDQKDNYVLPTFNYLKNWWQGFKYSLGSILCGLVFGFGSAVLIGIIALIFVAINAKILAIIVSILLAIITIVALVVLTLAFIWIFSNTGWVTSFLRINRSIELIKANPSTYWISFAFLFVLGTVGFLVNFVGALIASSAGSLLVSVIIEAVIAALFTTYSIFVFAYLVAKAIKPVKIVEDAIEEFVEE